MRYTIDDAILSKYNLTEEEFIALVVSFRDLDIQRGNDNLVAKGIADRNIYDKTKIVLSDNTKNMIGSIIVDSDKETINREEEFLDVAQSLRELYPKGKKPGTTYMWKDSNTIIAQKLKTLVVKFGYKFTKEQAIEATRRYIESFRGDYRYMQLLKYFILKTDRSTGEIRSDFMSYIDNENQGEVNSNWLSEIR